MHDIVAHNLSVMIALADGASYAVHDAPDAREAAMQTASRTGRQALAEMRRLLGVLRDDDPSRTGGRRSQASRDRRAARAGPRGRPAGSLLASGAPPPVPGGLELAAYRIVQEALTNTLKHAGAGAAAASR